MTQELLDLRLSLVEKRYDDALELVDELEEMSKQAILRNIESFLTRLIVHLIKNQVEKRLTNSWVASISDSVLKIKKLGSPKKVRMVVILSLKEFRLMKLASECRSILVMHRILTCNPQENRYSSPQRVHILSAFEKDVNLDIPCYV